MQGPSIEQQLQQEALRRGLIERQRLEDALLRYSQDSLRPASARYPSPYVTRTPTAGPASGKRPNPRSLLQLAGEQVPPSHLSDAVRILGLSPDRETANPMIAALSMSAPTWLAGPEVGLPFSIAALLAGSLLAAAGRPPVHGDTRRGSGFPGIVPPSEPVRPPAHIPATPPGRPPELDQRPSLNGRQDLPVIPPGVPPFSSGDPELDKLLAPGGIGPWDNVLPDPQEWLNDLPIYVENSKGGPQVQKEVSIITDKILKKAKQYGVSLLHKNGGTKTEKTFQKVKNQNKGARRTDLSFQDEETKAEMEINHHDTWRDRNTLTRRENLAAQDIKGLLQKNSSLELLPKSRWFSSQQEWEKVIDNLIDEAFKRRFGPPPK